MEDVIENNVAPEEVVPLETQENNEAKIETPNTDQTDQKEGGHFRRLREKQRELEKELQFQRDMNERLMQLAPRQAPVAEEIEEPDHEFIPKGTVKKVAKREVEPLQRRIDELEKKLEQQNMNERINSLRRQYSDFDQIVNEETLAMLDEQEPELAEAIAKSKDPYKLGMQAYKYIKALNIAQPKTDNRRQREIEKKIEKNEKTVPSLASFDKRPLAQAYVMTDKEKKDLWKETQGYASQAGFGY